MNALLSAVSFSETQTFKHRWSLLLQKKRSLDYEISKFAWDLRAKFGKGSEGDGDFLRWTEHNLQMVNTATAASLLNRAKIFRKAAPATPQAWSAIGGAKGAEALQKLPENVQDRAIAAAKANNTPITKALQEMKIHPVKSHETYKEDVIALAKYLGKTYNSHPVQIRNIILKYLDK